MKATIWRTDKKLVTYDLRESIMPLFVPDSSVGVQTYRPSNLFLENGDVLWTHEGADDVSLDGIGQFVFRKGPLAYCHVWVTDHQAHESILGLDDLIWLLARPAIAKVGDATLAKFHRRDNGERENDATTYTVQGWPVFVAHTLNAESRR